MSTSAVERNPDPPARLDAWLYLDEVTHRTLNDYAAMLSMLRRASRAMTDSVGRHVLDAVGKRLEAGVAAYDVLRPNYGSPFRNLDEDLERLCAALTNSILTDRSIRLTLRSDRVTLSARRSWQVSLIVSELVMNAAKHAFPRFGGGAIAINVHVEGAHVHCAVIDNGRGNPHAAPGRGSAIIDALADELRGQVFRSISENGSTILLSVPLV